MRAACEQDRVVLVTNSTRTLWRRCCVAGAMRSCVVTARRPPQSAPRWSVASTRRRVRTRRNPPIFRYTSSSLLSVSAGGRGTYEVAQGIKESLCHSTRGTQARTSCGGLVASWRKASRRVVVTRGAEARTSCGGLVASWRKASRRVVVNRGAQARRRAVEGWSRGRSVAQGIKESRCQQGGGGT
jgi:hypothetical protein